MKLRQIRTTARLRRQYAWAILRGRPVAYGLIIHGGIELPSGTRGARIHNNLIVAAGPDTAGITCHP